MYSKSCITMTCFFLLHFYFTVSVSLYVSTPNRDVGNYYINRNCILRKFVFGGFKLAGTVIIIYSGKTYIPWLDYIRNAFIYSYIQWISIIIYKRNITYKL